MILALLLAAQPQTLAVLEFRDKVPAEQRIDAAYLSDQVRAAAKELMPQAKVITRENMLVLLQASGKKLDECEGECEVETGRRIGADLVASGELLHFGTNYKLNMKLHDTRSGELLSGAVASGATADELDRALRPAVEKLLAPMRPEAFQDRLSDQRAMARHEADSPARRIIFAVHAAIGAGYGDDTRTLSVATTLAGLQRGSASVFLDAGVEGGLRLSPAIALELVAGIGALPSNSVTLVLTGAVIRFQVADRLALAAGPCVAFFLGKDSNGYGGTGELDYSIAGPLALRLQLTAAFQASAGFNATEFGGGAGLSLLY